MFVKVEELRRFKMCTYSVTHEQYTTRFTTVIMTTLGVYQAIGSTLKILMMAIFLVVGAMLDLDSLTRLGTLFLIFSVLVIHSRQAEATVRLDFLWKMQANGNLDRFSLS